MKQNRLLSIILVGLTIFGLSVCLDVKAAEVFDVGEEAFSSVEKTGADGEKLFDVVDSEGNVLKDLSEDELSALKDGEVRTLKSLAYKFGKESSLLSKEDSEAFLEDNAKLKDAVSSLKNEDLNLARRTVSGKIDNINDLKGLNRADNAVDRIAQNMKTMEKAVSKNITQLSKDAQLVKAGKMDLKNFCEKYKRMDAAMKDEAVGALNALRDVKRVQPSLDDLYADYGKASGPQAQKAIMDQILQKAKDIAVTDGMKSAGDLQTSLLKDAGNGLGGYEKECSEVLSQQVKDIDVAMGKIDPADLDGEISTGEKDAQGNDIKISKLDQALQKMRTEVEGSSAVALKSLKSELSVKIEQLGDKVGFAGRRMSGIWYRTGALADKLASADTYFSSITRDDAAEGFCSIGRGLKTLGGKVADFLEESGKLLLNGVGFMIPNIFQSAFLAQKQRQAALQTLANPVKFGDWVFQIPDSCFNFDNPSATIPIYVRVPVKTPTDIVSPAMVKQFDQTISGPTSDNKVSAAIHTTGAAIVSFGADLTARPKRYKIDEAAYLAHNPGIILAYFSGGYQSWGSVPLTSSQFTSGQVIDISTGLIVDGSGNQVSATGGFIGFDAYPLKVPTDWHQNPPNPPLSPTDVKSFLASMEGKLSLSSDDVKYVQYVTISAGSTGATASNCLQNAFDCSCLNDGASAATCTKSKCMISKTLDDYKTGDAVDSDLLGSVIPMYGWGKTAFIDLINSVTFPGFETSTLGQTIAAKINSNGSETLTFASPDLNYAVEGCWVYLSANTPFAQALQNGGFNNSVNGPYVDYIIFLDKNNAQVPFMVPVEKQYGISSKAGSSSGGYYTELDINTNIAYWTSIAAFNNASTTAIPAFADPKTGNPIKYNLNGTAIEDPMLAGAAKSGGVIASAIADLQNFPELYQQFTTHQAAMIDKINNGPFEYGSVSLTLSSYNIATVTAPIAEVPLYEGSFCFGSTTPDLLVALDENNNYLTLPNPNVATFYSLITDVGYSVSGKNLIPSNFTEAQMLQLIPNSSPARYSMINTAAAKNSYAVLDQLLEASLEAEYPLPQGTTSYISTALNAYVVDQRNSWAQLFDPSVQKQGVTVGSLHCSMPAQFHTKAAVASNCFIYEISPNPSSLCDNDLFVLTNSAQPSLSSLALINAQDATAKSYAVSLITGFVFDMQGNPVMSGNIPVRIQTAAASTTSSGTTNKVQTISDQIYNAIIGKFDFATIASAAFESKYKAWVQAYEKQMHRPMGPYKFGSLRLGIFAGDDAIGNFVYFSAQGMHEENFVPRDVYVTYDGVSSYADALTDSTVYVISLISGNVYDANGNIVNRVPSASLISLTQSLENGWGNWLKNMISDLQEDLSKRLAAEESEQTHLDTMLDSVSKTHDIYMTKAAVASIIARLTPEGLQGLVAPYGLLKYDDIEKIYVHVSPLSQNETDGLLYLFFDIGTDKATNKDVGGIFTASGDLVHMVTGIMLEVVKNQFGVIVDEDKTQKLGIPLTQPFFKMQEPESTLTLGSNSSSGDLISSNSDMFPGGPVAMAQGLYLYYSTIMKTYYVYDSSVGQWISCSGGHVYDKNGSPVSAALKVAMLQPIKSKKTPGVSSADDMILLYENSKNNMQGYINGQNYVNIDQSSGDMSWINLSSSDNDTLQVTASSNGSTYTVVDASNATKVYQVSSKYVWHSLFAVPLDEKTGSLVDAVGSSYKTAQMVMSGMTPTHILFNDVMYKVELKGSNVYNMTPINSKNKSKATLKMMQDEQTTARYVQVDDGKNSYNYLYVMDSLNEDSVNYYRFKMQGATSPTTHAFPVGPVISKQVIVGKSSVTVSVPKETTHVLFVKDIPKGSAGLSVVAPAMVQDIPTGPESAAFYANFTNNVLSSTDGRFFAQLPAYSSNATSPLSVSYVSNGAYVDLYTGALYDLTHGISLGYCLNLDDWLAILNHLCVSVTVKTTLKKSNTSSSMFALQYRSAQAVNLEVAQLEVDQKAQAQVENFAKSVPSLSGVKA